MKPMERLVEPVRFEMGQVVTEAVDPSADTVVIAVGIATGRPGRDAQTALCMIVGYRPIMEQTCTWRHSTAQGGWTVPGGRG